MIASKPEKQGGGLTKGRGLTKGIGLIVTESPLI